ncbi:MAG: outer membrane protein assembly factor BamC [Arenicellales bacterium]
MNPSALIIRLLFIGSLLSLVGCGSTQEVKTSKPAWDRTTQLEIPPDLTAPTATPGSEQFSAAARDASQAERDQYAEFQKFQQMADFQDFMEWREKYSATLDLSIEAFREARDQKLAQSLVEQGVLNITASDGQKILLISDTMEKSWQRLETAALNMGVHIVSRRQDNGVLRIHYGTEQPEQNSGWTDWLPWLSDPIIFSVTLELIRSGPSITVRDDEGNMINTELANSFIDRLGVQLRTFSDNAGETNGNQPNNELSARLEETASGHLALIVKGAAGAVWKQLDQKIRDTEFSVIGRDLQNLSFRIRYDDPSRLAEKSWVDSLAFWRDDESAPAEDIELILTPTGSETRIDALNESKAQSDVGDQVLTLILKSFEVR